MPPTARSLVLREAKTADLGALAEIEEASFETDRISRRSFRHLLTRGHAATFVLAKTTNSGSTVVAYATLLLHKHTAVGRLYSMAVRPSYRGGGLARRLLDAVEDAARKQGCVSIRLEVAPKNKRALRIYETRGYRLFRQLEDYYEDHGDALRLEKRLARHGRRAGKKVPYYRQSLDFTCGPAALMMAMRALSRQVRFDRATEVGLWREATTVFMTSGHGGCSPYGLALAAARRGFAVDLHVASGGETLFVNSVRSEEKREVIRLVDQQFKTELKRTKARVHRAALDLAGLDAALARSAVPVVLISNYRIYGERAPHWVTVVGADDSFLYVNDPWVDEQEGRGVTESMELPIHRREFLGMARYGRAGQRAALLIGRRG
jgi:ribosomal protein S18 acetylase RimI-like enzyme